MTTNTTTPARMLSILSEVASAFNEHRPNILKELLEAWAYDKAQPDFNNWSHSITYVFSYLPRGDAEDTRV